MAGYGNILRQNSDRFGARLHGRPCKQTAATVSAQLSYTHNQPLTRTTPAVLAPSLSSDLADSLDGVALSAETPGTHSCRFSVALASGPGRDTGLSHRQVPVKTT